ncbi:OmpA family protein [Shimia gijangensis]|uniref:OmpA family protein n=1 Tax=Shimia gijangensis TaxID=1470563 RepID=A0A1M6NQE8_9RHOB|nr:OmpA family protein [Shimia gijangensis]SHJ97943.1 OmpA family protein [Shimia gijangensis]
MSRFISAFFTVFLLAQPLASQQITDVAGAADPEGLPRIEGAAIIGFDHSGFDAVDLPMGPVTFDGPEAKRSIEGPRTRIIYAVPGDRSPLEVIRNYQAELDEQGFEKDYTCAKQDCGPVSAMVRHFYPLDGRLENMGRITRNAFSSPREDQQYHFATDPDTGRVVSIFAAFETFDLHTETEGKVLVLVDVIEAAPLQRRMETVTADQMASALGTDGRISLYGILFEHDSDQLTPASDPTLAEIAALTQGNPALTLFVVGHTDMTGGFDYNIGLSQRRATAVVAALTSRYGVAPDRLQPAGVGPLSPVADNTTDEGRTQNRRVELVQR